MLSSGERDLGPGIPLQYLLPQHRATGPNYNQQKEDLDGGITSRNTKK